MKITANPMQGEEEADPNRWREAPSARENWRWRKKRMKMKSRRMRRRRTRKSRRGRREQGRGGGEEDTSRPEEALQPN